MQAIGVGASKELKDRALAFAISADVKMQDMMYPIYSVSRSGPGLAPVIGMLTDRSICFVAGGAQLAWEWFHANRADLQPNTNQGIMQSVVSACSAQFVTAEKVAEVEAYFEKEPMESAKRKISQNLEGMNTSVAFLEHLLQGKLSQEGFFDFLVGLYLDKAEVRPRAESNANEMDDLLG